MKKLIAFLLALTLLATLPLLAGCQKVDKELPIRIWTLNGTTGFGMAQLIDADTKGEAALNYEFTVETSAPNVQAALINGTADIAALPTNAASALYNKTEGGVVLLALNTRGVLYLVVNTAKVTAPTSLADLSGKTVYVPATNPTFITEALIDKAAVTNVTLDSTTYAEPAALRDAVASGLVDYAVLPEPMVTIATTKATQANQGVTLSAALDLTAEWDKHFTPGSLVQGCIVARKAFVEEHPNEIKQFLEEYEASINFVVENPANASEMIKTAGIFEQAPVAAKAIPKCNFCYIDGQEMKTAMETFLAAMPENSIGGALPAEDFYYGA
ncbi:MAG: ABC transporter substrate-binding protein [Clostridia bacterium]|nr:ABC transporter substrate-binding protein [Clostridia bacterium]